MLWCVTATHPSQRPGSIGVFRLWRDLGYAIGAVLTGLLADQFGLVGPILAIGLLTIASSLIIKYRMSCAPKKHPIPDANLTDPKTPGVRANTNAWLDFGLTSPIP